MGSLIKEFSFVITFKPLALKTTDKQKSNLKSCLHKTRIFTIQN